MQGLNLILRLAWLQTVLHSNFGHVDYRVTGLFLAALEVIRRGQWNFYRYFVNSVRPSFSSGVINVSLMGNCLNGPGWRMSI